MSFFGNSTPLGASTPAKPGGLFGSSFGGGSTPAAPSFGAPAAQQQTAALPTFGATGTGQGFGTTSATPAFGTQGSAPPFGTSAATGFGGFGTSNAATTAPSLGGFGNFGTNTATTSAAPTLGGFGNFGGNTATTTTPSLFGGGQGLSSTGFGGFGGTTGAPTLPGFGGFGGNTATSSAPGGFGGFGLTSTTTTAPAFGGFGTSSTGFGGFGSGGTPFSSTLGKSLSTVTPGFGSLGGGASNFMLGQAQQAAPQQITADEAFAQSISNVSIYGDERDIIIAKWNYLQAMWGTGKAFYSQTAPPVDITPQNYLCRFKAICYVRLPGSDNRMGLVAINFNKPAAEIRSQRQQIINTLNAILGNKPTLVVNINSLKELEEKKSQIEIYIEEKSQQSPNECKRIPATDAANFLNQPNWKMQLNNFGVIEILALTMPDEDQLKEYLDNPPKGIDPRMWNQAITDNPNPKKLIPAPIYTFSDLKARIKWVETENETHSLYLKRFDKNIAEIKLRLASAISKIAEQKRKVAELTHSILKIIVKQECTRKIGMPLTAEEEALRTKLENMLAVVSAPTQFKGRLSELLSQMRMQRSQRLPHSSSEYKMDKDSEEEMTTFLTLQQNAIEVIKDTVTKDVKSLDKILGTFSEVVRQ